VNVRSAAATKIIGGVGLLSLLALGWVFVLSPRSNSVADVHRQTGEVREQNDTLRQQIRVLRAQQTALGEVRASAKALAAKFPPTADQPELFRQVTRAAVEAGLPATKVTALTPQAPVAGTPGRTTGVQLPGEATISDLAVQKVTMSVEGPPDQLQRLLRNIELMRRAYLVTSLTLGQGTDPGIYSATIAGDMFVMPSAPDPATVAAPAPGK